MAYTLKQLTMAWTATHDGIAPDAAATASLTSLVNQGFSDAKSLSAVLNDADSTTSVAVMAYQFFTGKSPTKDGLDYLVNSAGNPTDLNDPYYAKFNLENRFMNFAANLAIHGEGATAFAARYGAMSYADFVASIYETIVGASLAKAAGLDPAASIASIIASKDGIRTAATSAGMITANSTPQQIDLALKTATAAYLLLEGIKADVGVYASATNNFMLALATGTAVYNTDITTTYASYRGAGSEGTGHAVDNAPVLPGGDPPPEPPPVSYSLGLTPGVDALTGDVLNDTFNGTHLTFTTNDALNGLGGADTLNVTATTGATYTLPTASITSIETANLSNDAGLTANTTSWTGLTTLNTTSAGATTLTAHATTNVTANVSQGAANINILNGNDITLNVTGATSGNIVLLGAKGDISVTRAVTGIGNAGNITITGGADIDVTLTGNAAPAAGATRTMGTIFIDASDAAHTVKITAPRSITDDGSHGAVTAPTVVVRDANYSSLLAGTITTVEVDGFGGTSLGVNGSAVTTLKASHGTGIHVDNSDAVAAPVTSLAATLNDIHGVFNDEGVYQTLNVTQGAERSEIDLQMAALTALNVGGAGVFALTGLTTPNLATVTASGTVGLEGVLTAPAALTLVDTRSTTGASTVTINGAQTEFKGGAGVDSVTFSTTTVSQAVSLGGGDDVLILAPGATTLGATMDGGAGTADVLRVDGASANTANMAANLTGFERLEITDVAGYVLDVDRFGALHHITMASRGAGVTTTTLSGLDSGDTVALAFASNLTYSLQGTFGAANDTLNVELRDSVGNGPNFGTLSATGIETLDITTVNTAASPTGLRHGLSLVSNGVEKVVAHGNIGLSLTNTSNTTLSVVDASGLTLGGLALTLQAAAAAITITGSATANNAVTTSGGLASVITYTGGSAFDQITLTSTTIGGAIDLGGGDDLLTLASGIGAPTATINGGGGTSDTLTMFAADAATASGSGVFSSKVINFERLTLNSVSNQAINLANLTGYHHITVASGSANGFALNGMATGDTLVLESAGAGTFTAAIGANTANDTLNLTLSDSAGAGLTFTSGLDATGFEHLVITTDDGRTTPTGAMETLTLTGAALQTVVVAGDAGLTLTNAVSTALTSVDASGITQGGLDLTLTVAASAITVTGAAAQDNIVVVDAALATALSYNGGTGADDITVRGGANVIDVGIDLAGDAVRVLAPGATGAIFTTISHLAAGDTVQLGASVVDVSFGAAVNVSGAADLDAALDLAAAGTTVGHAAWFEQNGTTYVVFDLSTDTTFKDGIDYVVALTGTGYALNSVSIAGDLFTF